MRHFIKISYFVVLCLLLSTVSLAQMHNGQYGNEWINHNQEYYKIKIIDDGFYTIDRQTLENYITNIEQIDFHNIQLFHMGQEVPIYIETNNGELDAVSFYAEKNKGELDVNLYRKPHNHFNPEYSLISDTASYFLTWNVDGVSKQYQNYTPSFNNIPQKEPYFIHESKTVLNQIWNRGKYRVYGGYSLSNGTYDFGEGYGGSFQKNNTIPVNTPSTSNIGPNPVVKVKAYAFGYSYHNLELSVGNYTQSYSSYYGDSVIDLSTQISLSDITSNLTNVEINGLSGNNDKHAVSVVSIVYPREFDFEGKSLFKFNLEASNSRKFLEINNFNGGASGTQNVYLYDITNNLRVQCYWDGTTVRLELPPSLSDRELVLVNEISNKNINELHPSVFEDYSFSRGDYIVITNPKLFRDSNGNNPVLDYCMYRATTGHLPVIVPIQRLYDQFAYGIDGHPIAIKNFISYAKNNWETIVPKNVFLIGKGRIYKEIRNITALDNLVPTFGSPPSDNLLLAPIGSDVPMLPVGRLAATTGDQVRDYLNKIKHLETAAKDSLDFKNQNWRKQMIHLGGGANDWENSLLKNHLLAIEPVMEDGNFGATVHSFFKEQNDHVSVPNSQKINDLINDGVSMVTFFGHGSTKGFDFYLDAPERYKNKDKYPLVMALGCYNGTIFGSDKLISERFLFEQEAGAIGYIGFVDAVTISAAAYLSSTFYEKVSEEFYGEGMGTLIKKTLEDYTSLPSYLNSDVLQMGGHYLVFHGDPALKLNYRNTPDYYIDETTIRTNPEVISEDIRNFKLEIDVYNLGKYIDSTFIIKVIRKHPSGLIDTSISKVSTPKDKKTVELMFPVNGYEDFGLNSFKVIVDANNNINEEPLETAEENNRVENYQVIIGNPVVVPTYPKEYAIVNDSILLLKAMTTNAFKKSYTWVIEIDTTINFNSPELAETTIISNSSLVEWNPNIVLNDEWVYYWRVQVIDDNQQVSDWVNSSFVFKPNSISSGWNQSHVYQYQKNDLQDLEISANENSIFNFTPSLYEISVKTGYINYGIDNENLALFQNGSKVDKCRCANENGIYVAVLDPETLDFWTLPGATSKYGAINCDGANRTAYSFLFKNATSSAQKSFESFVMDTIPEGHMVIIYTLNNAYGQRWSSNITDYLKTQGATKIDSFVNTNEERSYAIAYKKGNLEYPYFSEEIGYNKYDAIAAFTATNKDWTQGQMTSSLIGPAQRWEKLEWNATHLEMPEFDSVSIDIWGVNEYGEKQILYSKLKEDTLDLTFIDVEDFPYLQLTLNNKDELNLTPAQLNFWRVYGEMNTDAAITIEDDYAIEHNSVNNQHSVVLDLAVWNMGSNPIDSSELEIFVLGSDTAIIDIEGLNVSDSANVQINIPLLGLVGQQVIVAKLKAQKNETTLANNWGWVEVNVPNNPSIVPGSNEKNLFNQNTDVVSRLNNYPNPFANETLISFELAEFGEEGLPETVSIEMYDARGLLVRQTIQPAETVNTWSWNGKNEQSLSLPSGVYFCKVVPMYKNNDTQKLVKHKIIKILLAR
ncbi:MAG: C25 family cysteine peptidase [Saprospiraceae bacterium]|nr:C25 family cysteine peptidase [Saprospiraceae bacterium]